MQLPPGRSSSPAALPTTPYAAEVLPPPTPLASLWRLSASGAVGVSGPTASTATSTSPMNLLPSISGSLGGWWTALLRLLPGFCTRVDVPLLRCSLGLGFVSSSGCLFGGFLGVSLGSLWFLWFLVQAPTVFALRFVDGWRHRGKYGKLICMSLW